MILERLFQRSGVQLLKKTLEAASLRHRTVSENIANIGTPGYRRKEVKFQDELQGSMQDGNIIGKRTDSRHFEIGGAKKHGVSTEIKVDTSEENASGVNNVDIDKEMADLAKNQIHFSATATLVARKFRGLKSAIRGRSFG